MSAQEKKPRNRKVFIGVSVQKDQAEQLKDTAKRLDLSVSQLFRRFVKDGIESVKREKTGNLQ